MSTTFETSSVTVDLVQELLCFAVQEVFKTMAGTNAAFEKLEDYVGKEAFMPELSPGGAGETTIAASVGFTGKINGVIFLFLGQRFGSKMAARITGLDAGDIDREVLSDVAGELTNMLSGMFKNRLSDRGLASTLGVPTVVIGKELSLSSMAECRQYRLRFNAEGDPVYADLVLREN
ncbi:MAG: chemotaxis protein CheX [Puniceicoccaceae bacterium]|nr:MAG: chemotaxis protein CheX [Puniceicoccaceae bacterium]